MKLLTAKRDGELVLLLLLLLLLQLLLLGFERLAADWQMQQTALQHCGFCCGINGSLINEAFQLVAKTTPSSGKNVEAPKWQPRLMIFQRGSPH